MPHPSRTLELDENDPELWAALDQETGHPPASSRGTGLGLGWTDGLVASLEPPFEADGGGDAPGVLGPDRVPAARTPDRWGGRDPEFVAGVPVLADRSGGTVLGREIVAPEVEPTVMRAKRPGGEPGSTPCGVSDDRGGSSASEHDRPRGTAVEAPAPEPPARDAMAAPAAVAPAASASAALASAAVAPTPLAAAELTAPAGPTEPVRDSMASSVAVAAAPAAVAPTAQAGDRARRRDRPTVETAPAFAAAPVVEAADAFAAAPPADLAAAVAGAPRAAGVLAVDGTATATAAGVAVAAASASAVAAALASAPGDGAPGATEPAILEELRARGISDALAQRLLSHARADQLPFAAAGDLRDAVRAELTQVLPQFAGLPEGALVAVVGGGGSGKTRVAATLAAAHRASSARTVRTVAVGGAARDRPLAGLLAEHGIPVAAAEPAGFDHAREADERAGQLVVLDTPAVAPGNPRAIAILRDELADRRPDAVLVTVPVRTSRTAAAQLLTAPAPLRPSALVLTHSDETDHLGPAIELSIDGGIPIAYVHRGLDITTALRAADPGALAALLLA